jgi:hypothetical protein
LQRLNGLAILPTFLSPSLCRSEVTQNFFVSTKQLRSRSSNPIQSNRTRRAMQESLTGPQRDVEHPPPSPPPPPRDASPTPPATRISAALPPPSGYLAEAAATAARQGCACSMDRCGIKNGACRAGDGAACGVVEAFNTRGRSSGGGNESRW